jgi:hypothetical protein
MPLPHSKSYDLQDDTEHQEREHPGGVSMLDWQRHCGRGGAGRWRESVVKRRVDLEGLKYGKASQRIKRHKVRGHAGLGGSVATAEGSVQWLGCGNGESSLIIADLCPVPRRIHYSQS